VADTPTSLLSKAWGAVISLLGIAVTLAFIVSIIQSIWPWLVSIAVAVFVMTAVVLLLRRWWERGRW
jgi:uncharacterized membrane protein YccC